jgi:D-tyrosyl-tRNA(Tyr) deacylase
MRVVLQRVKSASVTVAGAEVAAIDTGLLVLLGFSQWDVPGELAAEHTEWLARKVLGARLFPSPEGRQWAASAASARLPLLLVSQFTLHGSLRKPKPDFHRAAGTEGARALWHAAVACFERCHSGGRVATGVFGADMEVRLCNWGPVTLTLDSANRKEACWEEGGGGGGGAAAAALEEEGELGEASAAPALAASSGSAAGASEAQ